MLCLNPRAHSGDIGAHIIDLAQLMLGEKLTGVSAIAETFAKPRPLPDSSSGLSATGGQISVRLPSMMMLCSWVASVNGALATFVAKDIPSALNRHTRTSYSDSNTDRGIGMTRKVTLLTRQWAELPVEEGSQAGRRMGL